MKWILAVLALAAGCAVLLLPGVLRRPAADDGTVASEAAGSTDEPLTELLEQLGEPTDTEVADAVPQSDGEETGGTPASAAEESDTDEVVMDYETVFPDEAVQRIDLVIAADDWQAMLDEASGLQNGGAAGMMRPDADGAPLPVAGDIPGPGDMPTETDRMPELFADVCVDCEAGDEVTVSIGGREVTGTCVESNGELVFRPGGEMMPGGRLTRNPEETTPPGDIEDGRIMGRMIDETADADLSYVPCTVVFDGKTWSSVGVRFKGNSTLLSTVGSGSWKYPLHLDFDEFEETVPETVDQRFFGFDDLSLSNAATDTSFLRDFVPAQVFRDFGVPTPEAAYYQVYLDVGDGPIFLGLYTVVETPDDPMLETQFGSAGGNLYKPTGSGATWSTFDEASFEKKSNQDEGDWSDIEAVFEALHASRDDAAAWRAGLEEVLDVDGFLRWLAVNQLLANWDAYGQMAQNYYLYSNPSDGRIHWIPWDLNQSLNPRMQLRSSSIDLVSVGEQWPLIRYLLDDPVYEQVYIGYVADALDTVFDSDALEALIRATAARIAPYLIDESGELSEYSFVSSADEVERATEEVVAIARQQAASGAAYLDENGYVETEIVLTEVHYNPGPNQGTDDEYEFIELANRGTSTVDLSGYRFDRGIEFTFPERTLLSPGTCLVLAKDASHYADLDCPVLEWDAGSLSNDGEVLRLVDADGTWVDRVAYDDRAPWPAGCDGAGASLELIDPDLCNHLASHWTASSTAGGTPGTVIRDE